VRQSGNELTRNSKKRKLGDKRRLSEKELSEKELSEKELSENALLRRIPRRVPICGQLRGDDRRTMLGNTCGKEVCRQAVT
jgi:hypothetical protein